MRFITISRERGPHTFVHLHWFGIEWGWRFFTEPWAMLEIKLFSKEGCDYERT